MGCLLSLWYKNARAIAKGFNKHYTEVMRSIRILEQELIFIEYIAKKAERISAYRFDPSNFWDSMAGLENLFDEVDQIYTTDLMYFDYLIGRQKRSIGVIFGHKYPSFTDAVRRTKRIWGTLPDYYKTDPKLAKLPISKISGVNEYTTASGYKLSGVAQKTAEENAAMHQKNKKEMDEIQNTPVKYLQFENAFYVDRLLEKILYLKIYKTRILADGQILLTKSSLQDERNYNHAFIQ